MVMEKGKQDGMEVDEALTLLGRYGRWQITYFIILSIGMMFLGCWHTLAYVFQAHTPYHHCHIPEGSTINDSIPWDSVYNSYSRCLIYPNNSDYINRGDGSHGDGNYGDPAVTAGPAAAPVSCRDGVNKWDYWGEGSQSSIVVEWNLVCERAHLKKTTHLVTAFGIMVGTAFFTPLIDYFGRRPVFLALTWIMVGVGVCNAFVHNYYVYLVVRFLTGALRPGSGLAAFILACELFPASQRTFAGIIIEDFWGLAMCFLALFMYLIPDWRHLQLFISLLGLLSIPLYWFLPESIPWLITKGRVAEAEKTIQHAARVNRIRDFPTNVFTHTEEAKPLMEIAVNDVKVKNDVMVKHSVTNSLEVNNGVTDKLEVTLKNGKTDKPEVKVKNEVENKEEEYRKSGCHKLAKIFKKKSTSDTKYSILDVLRHRRLRFFTFTMSILWFVNSTVYYGMTLHTGDLDGNRYLNLFYSGLVEIPAYTLSYFIINRWGRRLPLVGFHVVAGAFLILSQVIPKETVDGTSLEQLRVIFTMIGKCGITASYGVVYIYAPELFPTTIRSQAMGVASIFGRIGNMLAPFSSSLNDIRPWMTSVVFGLVSVAGGLMVLTLPETNKRPLPQTIDEIEAWFKSASTDSQPINGSSCNNGTNGSTCNNGSSSVSDINGACNNESYGNVETVEPLQQGIKMNHQNGGRNDQSAATRSDTAIRDTVSSV